MVKQRIKGVVHSVSTTVEMCTQVVNNFHQKQAYN